MCMCVRSCLSPMAMEESRLMERVQKKRKNLLLGKGSS